MVENLLPDWPRPEKLEEMKAKYPGTDIPSVEVGFALRHIGSAVCQAFESSFNRSGLSSNGFGVLMQLRKCDAGKGVSPAELADKVRVSRATMTGLIDTLEKAGFVERQEHEKDRRMTTVKLTLKGDAQIDALLPQHFKRIQAALSVLSDAERTQLRTLLFKVYQGLPAMKEP